MNRWSYIFLAVLYAHAYDNHLRRMLIFELNQKECGEVTKMFLEKIHSWKCPTVDYENRLLMVLSKKLMWSKLSDRIITRQQIHLSTQRWTRWSGYKKKRMLQNLNQKLLIFLALMMIASTSMLIFEQLILCFIFRTK